MSKPKVINPDSAILQQLDGQWQKIAAILVWKFAPVGAAVKITADDFARCDRDHPKGLTLLAHGHHDSIDLKLVTPEEAAQIAEHDRKQHGHA